MTADPNSLSTGILTFLIFAPILAGVLAVLWPHGRALDLLAVGLGFAQLLVLFPLSAAVRDGPLMLALGEHLLPLGIALHVDGLSLSMLWLVGLVGLGTSVYATAWLRHVDHRQAREYRILWFLLMAALNALFLSGDLFNVYVTLEMTTLAAVALVILAGSPHALAAALRYLYFALIGSTLYLLGAALVYAETGLLALPLLGAVEGDAHGRTVALAVITAGLAIKAALFPVHGWLPRAHAAAPTPASALLSALVVQAAAYLLIRLWLGSFNGVWSVGQGQVLGALGAAGILYGSIQALRQQHLKRVIAYSTIAQLSYVLLLMPLAASLLAWQGFIYHVVIHGLAKAAFFLAAGNLILGAGHDRLAGLAGRDRAQSRHLLAMGIAGVSLAGLPPTGGFVAKWWMISAALELGQWWWALIIALGGVLAGLYVFRVIAFGLLDPSPWTEGTTPIERRHLSRPLLWPPMLLALLALALGFAGELLAPYIAVGAPGSAQ